MSISTKMEPATDRRLLLRRALQLEYLTVGWNMVEGVIAVAAAVLAGSVALLGFGIDSFVESASGAVMIWRLVAERRSGDVQRVERVERRAQRLVAGSLLALAIYILVDASLTLARARRPQPSYVGIAVTAVSLGVMWWLARTKRRWRSAAAPCRRTPSRPLRAGVYR